MLRKNQSPDRIPGILECIIAGVVIYVSLFALLAIVVIAGGAR